VSSIGEAVYRRACWEAGVSFQLPWKSKRGKAFFCGMLSLSRGVVSNRSVSFLKGGGGGGGGWCVGSFVLGAPVTSCFLGYRFCGKDSFLGWGGGVLHHLTRQLHAL